MRNYLKLFLHTSTIQSRQKAPPHTTFTFTYEIFGTDEDDADARLRQLVNALNSPGSANEYSVLFNIDKDIWLELNQLNVVRLIYPWQWVQTSQIYTDFMNDQWTLGGTTVHTDFGTDLIFVEESPRDTWSNNK